MSKYLSEPGELTKLMELAAEASRVEAVSSAAIASFFLRLELLVMLVVMM